MKKIFVLLICCVMHNCLYAQFITEADFENIDLSQFDTNGDGKIKDKEAALAIKELYELDKNNAITRVQIIDSIPKTKEQIYIDVNNWFIHSFQSGKSVIQLNDKDMGVIIGKGYVSNMGSTLSFASSANISAWVIIRVDIKDTKVKITTTIQSYEMDKGTGVLGALAGVYQTYHYEYIPTECFPFTKKNKSEGAKAFVKSHVYSLIIINKLKEAILNGLTGTEDDW